VFRVSDRSSLEARARAFLEQYEREFSWGTGREEAERFLYWMNELPENLKEYLTSQMGAGRFFHPVTSRSIQDWFFKSRIIRSGNRRVVMPIIELANHGGTAQYDTLGGVALRGMFENEVLVRYADPTDPYDMFVNWMFVPNEMMAFSLGMQGAFAGKQFEIGREFDDEQMPFLPKVTVDGDRVVASYLLLGHKQFPQVPKGAFRKAMGFVRLPDTDEAYDFMQMVNRKKFLTLLVALEGLHLPAATILRRLAHAQLMALSEHYGTREV
jgi:hypothetical protein